MQRHIAVIGVTERFSNDPTGGANAGNMVHARAARKMLQDYRDDPAGDWDEASVERVRAEASHILDVGANGVTVGSDRSKMDDRYAQLARNLQMAKMPVAVVGPGAQARTFDLPARPKLTPDAPRFVSVVSDRAEVVGVRGAFPADVLHRAGIRNVEVLGCPSCFMSLDPGFADKPRLRIPRARARRRTVANCTYPGIEKNPLRLIWREKPDLIGQMEFYEYQLRRRGPRPSTAGHRRPGACARR